MIAETFDSVVFIVFLYISLFIYIHIYMLYIYIYIYIYILMDFLFAVNLVDVGILQNPCIMNYFPKFLTMTFKQIYR